jgi:hypothetical protein
MGFRSSRLSGFARLKRSAVSGFKKLVRKRKECYFVYVRQNYGSKKGKFIKSPTVYMSFAAAKRDAKDIYQAYGKLTYVKKGKC